MISVTYTFLAGYVQGERRVQNSFILGFLCYTEKYEKHVKDLLNTQRTEYRKMLKFSVRGFSKGKTICIPWKFSVSQVLSLLCFLLSVKRVGGWFV